MRAANIVFTAFLAFILFFILGCSSKQNNDIFATKSQKIVDNPLGANFGDDDDTDPLKIGKTPTPPTNNFLNPQPFESPNFGTNFNQPNPQTPNSQTGPNSQISRTNSQNPAQNFSTSPNLAQNLYHPNPPQNPLSIPKIALQTEFLPPLQLSKLPPNPLPSFISPNNNPTQFSPLNLALNNSPLNNPLLNLTAAPKAQKVAVAGIPPDLFDRVSEFLIIMSPNNVTITIWATAPGNWLWGYSQTDSPDLGGLRIWRLIFLPENEVMITNFSTKTTCINTYGSGVIHAPCDISNPRQKFTLRPMTNGAVQIFNRATNSCLQTPINDPFNGDDFGAINLTSNCGDSLDLQWYLLPQPLSSALYD